jgi:hypothetical protein
VALRRLMSLLSSPPNPAAIYTSVSLSGSPSNSYRMARYPFEPLSVWH